MENTPDGDDAYQPPQSPSSANGRSATTLSPRTRWTGSTRSRSPRRCPGPPLRPTLRRS
jgi:hypothetical protein